MSIYDDLQKVAVKLFDEFQQGIVEYVTFTSPAGASPDDPGEPVINSTPIKATTKPVSTKYVDGTSIIQSDVEVSMANDGTVPSMKGAINIDGKRHKIIEIMSRPAAGTPITFTLIVRK